MQKQITLPNIGDFSGVEVIEVPVAVGDSVEAEQTLLVLETEKATMDVPSPVQGKVKSFKVSVGDKVSEGDLVAVIETSDEASDSEKQPDISNDAGATDSAPSASTSTAVETIHCPDIGDFASVDIIEVLVKPGALVEAETPLIVLETEKATMEIPSPKGGEVVALHVSAGSKISKGGPICDIKSGSRAASNTSHAAEQKSSPTAPQQPTGAKSLPSHQLDVYRDEPAQHSSGVYAGPAVRRMAGELGVDLSKVPGTGQKGRITREDLNGFVKSAIKGGGASGLGVEPMPEIDFSKFGEVEIKPLSRINKRSAKNLHRNWLTVPHVTQFDEADITELEGFRQDNKHFAAENGIKLTPLIFIMKAVVGAMRQYPRFNTSLTSDGESLVQKHYFHVGVAVDTPNGLVVPVVRNVDAKSLFQLAKELSELSKLAREGKLKAEHMQGSCFTISSLGGIGGTAFTPIVNAPDVAILGVSRSSHKPFYDNGQWVPRLMLPLSLSYDHRVIDGAEAARFITHLSDLLSQPKKLILT
ncbi:MAG: dihydrolipoamide acetyltransferase [Legionellales bacterium]|nr:dihydrolipoamide acetyltransferase [Legionellales bacterium]